MGRYADDIAVPGCLHAAFVRSPHASAGIRRIDASPALAVPGVIAVLTGADLAALATPLRIAPPIDGLLPAEMPPLPVDAARFAGDPVALVLAEDRNAARDGAEAVEVAWDPRPPVTSITEAAA